MIKKYFIALTAGFTLLTPISELLGHIIDTTYLALDIPVVVYDTHQEVLGMVAAALVVGVVIPYCFWNTEEWITKTFANKGDKND